MATKEIYKFFADYVYKHCGILYKEDDYYRLDSRINTMKSNFELNDDVELYDMYKRNVTKDMHDLLIDLFTNNETFFMRDLRPFKAMAKVLFPMLKEIYPQAYGYNIWSCASSTGQEVYSILMSLDSFAEAGLIDQVKVDASDISEDALRRARKGEYSVLEVQRGLPASFLIKYFDKDPNEETWVVKPLLRSKPNYFYFNLLESSYPKGKYHLIFCRNVLIYQDMDNKKRILEKIYNSLKPEGFIVFGAGESMIGIDLPFEQVQVDGSIFYKKKTK